MDFILGGRRDAGARRLGETNMRILLSALFEIDLAYLRAHLGTPRIYRAGVRYRVEPVGREHWRDVPTVLASGEGDCEDLACWRAAELCVRDGVAAVPAYTWRREPGYRVYHVVVRLPGGGVEDPSARLGMGRGAGGRMSPIPIRGGGE
ncbi:MAG: hypothetical protein IT376_13815 [Polyangiaceae bacterium]|nr:hypothetical protein [Polyangiaceae bacterium]